MVFQGRICRKSLTHVCPVMIKPREIERSGFFLLAHNGQNWIYRLVWGPTKVQFRRNRDFPTGGAYKAGLHKVKWCLQEFFDFKCACGKKHPSALSHATFRARLCCFYAFLYLLHSYLSVYFHQMYHLTLQITILAIVPGKPKMCLQENLVDCADCGGLLDTIWHDIIKTWTKES